jgi:hypothetical protein
VTELRARPEFDFWQGHGPFLRHSVQTGTGAHPEAFQMGTRGSDHSTLSSVEVKNAWRYISTTQYIFMAWRLIKHSNKFTFTLKVTFSPRDHFLPNGSEPTQWNNAEWRWRPQGPPKCWYRTSLHGVTTWRWKQQSPPKRWYPTTSLQSDTTQEMVRCFWRGCDKHRPCHNPTFAWSD